MGTLPTDSPNIRQEVSSPLPWLMVRVINVGRLSERQERGPIHQAVYAGLNVQTRTVPQMLVRCHLGTFTAGMPMPTLVNNYITKAVHKNTLPFYCLQRQSTIVY